MGEFISHATLIKGETRNLLLTKFFETIRKALPGGLLSEKEAKALAALNPQKIYIENVRSLLGVSHDSAVKICETAVRQGVFMRGIEVLCPDGAVAASAESESKLPSKVHCWVERDGEPEEEEFSTAELRRVVFYTLYEEPTSKLDASTS
jgi:hypothetical protein